MRISCSFDIQMAALRVVFLPVREGKEGELISTCDSELIVRLRQAGAEPVSATDGGCLYLK